jgi:hypothetical protein
MSIKLTTFDNRLELSSPNHTLFISEKCMCIDDSACFPRISGDTITLDSQENSLNIRVGKLTFTFSNSGDLKYSTSLN